MLSLLRNSSRAGPGGERRTRPPVCDGFGHEVVLGDVLGEGHQAARLVQDVLPHQTGHPRHALDPRHIGGDVGPRVGGAEVHLRAGRRLSAELRAQAAAKHGVISTILTLFPLKTTISESSVHSELVGTKISLKRQIFENIWNGSSVGPGEAGKQPDNQSWTGVLGRGRTHQSGGTQEAGLEEQLP